MQERALQQVQFVRQTALLDHSAIATSIPAALPSLHQTTPMISWEVFSDQLTKVGKKKTTTMATFTDFATQYSN